VSDNRNGFQTVLVPQKYPIELLALYMFPLPVTLTVVPPPEVTVNVSVASLKYAPYFDEPSPAFIWLHEMDTAVDQSDESITFPLASCVVHTGFAHTVVSADVPVQEPVADMVAHLNFDPSN